MKTLLAFGCSWTYGDELRDPVLKPWQACSIEENDNYRNSNCFGGLIAQHYNMQFVNMATQVAVLKACDTLYIMRCVITIQQILLP